MILPNTTEMQRRGEIKFLLNLLSCQLSNDLVQFLAVLSEEGLQLGVGADEIRIAVTSDRVT